MVSMKPTTTAQDAILRETLLEWYENEEDALDNAHNYEIGRVEINRRATRMINIAIFLEQNLGVKGMKSKAPSSEMIRDWQERAQHE